MNMKLSLILLAVTISVFVNASNHHHRSSRKDIQKRIHHQGNSRHHSGATRHHVESEKELVEKARKLVKSTKFVAITTCSSLDDLEDYAFINAHVTADGGTGIPYFYMDKKNPSFQGLLEDPKFSVLYSEAPSGKCENYPLKAKNPKCDMIDLTGDAEIIEEGSPEYKFGMNALEQQHPAIENFDQSQFVLLKMNIKAVLIMRENGSVKQLPLELYLNTQV